MGVGVLPLFRSFSHRDSARGDNSSFRQGEKAAAADTPGTIGLVADEPTRSIAPGGTATGVIDSSGDVDAFTVNLVAGQTYAISLRGTGDTPLADAFLTLSNSGGIVVASDDDGGQSHDSLLTFTATATGTYTIAAEGYPGDGQTGGYTLDVRQMGADSVGATIATAQAITVDQTKFGFLETKTDIDMYAVTLEAGTFYSIDLAGGADYDTNPNSVPKGELDTILTIYDSAGNVVATNDDVSFPDDISSAMGFTPDTSGTYYVKVDAYPQQTGGYTLDVRQVDLTGLDPLDSIDWGTQLPSNVVTVYFATAGQTFDGVTSLGWTQYEIDQAMAALETWAEVSNLSFSITNNSALATFKLVTTNSNEFLGYFNPPGETNAGVGVFAVNGDGWDNTGGLEPGGYGWITLVHEFGHGLGLAHPHDNGGGSEVMPGVTGPFDSFGVFDLNQGVYTTMSYNDGWQLHPNGSPTSLNYGWQAGPGAFDIALIQVKYGASTANTGDNVYVLPTANAAGTFWDVIWDTGGTDTIAHTGLVSATIDLTAATLDYSPTGAGVISYVTGIFGGFTIAAGVVIENASGGSGADVLIGNQASNILDGGAGNDTLQGNGAADTFLFGVGDGMDTVTDLAAGDIAEIRGYVSAQSVTQSGADVIVMLSASDRITFQDTTVAAVQAALHFPDAPPSGPTEGDDTLNGTDGDDVIDGLGGNDTINGLGGNDTIHGGSGDDDIFGGDGNDTLYGDGPWDEIDGGAGNDTIYAGPSGGRLEGGDGDDTIIGTSHTQDLASYRSASQGVTVSLAVSGPQVTGQGSDTLVDIDILDGSNFNDVLTGNDGANQFAGLDGDDQIFGGGGDDYLLGGNGDDQLDGGSGNDYLYGHPGADILDGGAGDDTLTGGDDVDTFKFDAGGGMDIVADLVAGEVVEIGGYASAQSITQDGADVIVILSDFDRITFQNTTAAIVSAALQFPSPPAGPTEGDDTLDGTGGDDTIDALGGNDTITGLGGNDILDGGAGNDWLDGGDGNDRLDGGTGDDAMAGGAGQDKYFVDSLGDTITELLGGGSDTVHSSISWTLGANIESLILDGTANINGTGNNTGNVIRRTSGINSLSGGGGGDRLFGNAGNDTLHGGAGNDKLEGGAGQDLLIGSTGADSFVFRGGDFAGLTTTTADRINDFSQAEGDTIDLGAVDADSLTGGDQAFTFIGTGAFTNTAGELRYQLVNTNVFVYGDTNGDGIADFMIRLANFTAPLTEGDFVI